MLKNAVAAVMILICGCDGSFIPYSDEWQEASNERKQEAEFQKHQVALGGTVRSANLEISPSAVARDGDRIGITAVYKNISLDQVVTSRVFVRDGRDESGNPIYRGDIPIPDGENYKNLSKQLNPGESTTATFYVRPKVKTAKTATLRLISGDSMDDSQRSKWLLRFDIPN